ncbi:LLM class F420-dependent oxidoreductase [Allostreptomyces psammosilenae]|uniref:Putative F420-dependent oxidoreductase n=1 Tax=Allostreptomyces psammosilenae TaxID=1892865 RepID=A0A853A0X6_9ACTN|nr:LLM class F420-dependent oxidoreductase [Allostreptomyces psammosilenae]NYI04058.1 putative F420-dependent oxidoreductase [Allostreptomyces psammosilenae]
MSQSSAQPSPPTPPPPESRPFRFGVNLVTTASRDQWAATCRTVESLGFDVLLVPDHIGAPAPFPSLVAAAEVTERPRLGTFVLNAGFWNPTLLAREAAGTDALTGGRLELGLGAGYVRAEFEDAGIEFHPAGERVNHLERTVREVRRRFADKEFLPRPTQPDGPPLLVGGHGRRTLRLAAEHADVVGFTAGRVSRDGKLTLAPREEFAERVRLVREAAAGRAVQPELNLLIQRVLLTEDRRAAVRPFLPYANGMDEEELLRCPVLLVGTAEQIAEQLRRQREEFGISYVTVLEPSMEAFGPVIELLS